MPDRTRLSERQVLMSPLFTCRACGFLSTLGSEFERIEGVTFDRECASAFRSDREPVATWVREKLPALEQADE